MNQTIRSQKDDVLSNDDFDDSPNSSDSDTSAIEFTQEPKVISFSHLKYFLFHSLHFLLQILHNICK